MALSHGFLDSPRFQAQSVRRLSVFMFAMCAFEGMRYAHDPMRVEAYAWFLVPLSAFVVWQLRGKTIRVSTLDDHAMLECGRLFDELDAKEQGAILDTYRGGTQVMNAPADERDRLLRSRALEQAYSVLRVVLPLQALLCAAWWYWGQANVLILLSWLVIVVLSMPQLVMMWTTPDEVREMHPVLPVAQREREV